MLLKLCPKSPGFRARHSKLIFIRLFIIELPSPDVDYPQVKSLPPFVSLLFTTLHPL